MQLNKPKKNYTEAQTHNLQHQQKRRYPQWHPTVSHLYVNTWSKTLLTYMYVPSIITIILLNMSIIHITCMYGRENMAYCTTASLQSTLYKQFYTARLAAVYLCRTHLVYSE